MPSTFLAPLALSVSLLLSASLLRAGSETSPAEAPRSGERGAGWRVSSEVGYTGRAGFDGGGESAGSLDATDARVGVGYRARIAPWASAGFELEWERFAFGLDGSEGLIPNGLQSFSLGFTGSFALSRAVELRAGLTGAFSGNPGDLGGEDFHVSGLLMAGVRQTRAFTWFAGFTAGSARDLPVLPALGFVWEITPKATLRVGFPVSELGVALGGGWRVAAVTHVKGGTFRASDDFGEPVDREELNGAWMTYRDLRVGVRLTRAFGGRAELFAEAGAAVWRQFHYEEADLRVEGNPAPYGALGASIRF